MAAPEPKPSPPFPRLLGPYRLLNLIGKGGMGEIFLAEDPLFERKVALKKILSKLVPYSSIKKRFLNEAKIAARLAHPSIIPIHSLHVEGDQIYYTMPYVKGETLKAILKDTRDKEQRGDPPHSLGSSIPALMRVFLSVCQAIDYAHANGFLHRDLKPENIIVGKFGEVMILDWGIALSLQSKETFHSDGDVSTPASHFTDLTRPGKVVGTVNYMAPERAFGRASTVQTDIYSLGVVLYQLLTLRLPFTRPSLKDFKKNLQQEQWIDPQELAPHRDIPQKLALLAKNCIQPNPALRLHSVRAIIAELEDYIEGRPAWISTAHLCPQTQGDWEFQENIPLAKHTAISNVAGELEWVMLMLSKESYSGNTKIETHLKLQTHSSGIGFLLCVPSAQERDGCEEGYLIWIGSKKHPGCRLFRKGVEMVTVPDQALTCGARHKVAIEKSDHHLRLFIDDRLILDYINQLPLIGGHIGLLARDTSFAIDQIDVLLGSQSATVNCLAIPDAFLTSRDYTQALLEYRRIARSFQGRIEAREALFRAGMTLFEQGKAAADQEEKERFFDEAFDEFEKLHNTPGAPLEYLGKSLIYHQRRELGEEVKYLELALRKYAKHPLFPLIEEHIGFRLHEAALKQRQAAYSFLLLALRHLPRILASRETQSLIDHLTATWEQLSFIEPIKAFSSLAAQNISLAIDLSFWLAQPTALYELSQAIDPHWPEGLTLLGNILFTLLEMDYPNLASYIATHLERTFHPLTSSPLQEAMTFIRKTASASARERLTQALETFPSLASQETKRLFYYLLKHNLTLDMAPSLLPLFERLAHPDLVPLHFWAALLTRNKGEATRLLQTDFSQKTNYRSPTYFLYGCYLALTEGEEAAKAHLAPTFDKRYPPTPALLSYYLFDQHQLETTWMPHAFSCEKIALYRQLALYFHCLGQSALSHTYEKRIQEEQVATRIPLNFL